MEIGQHCAFTTCGRLDFLPFTCNLCQQVFCKEHRSPENHECRCLSSLCSSTSSSAHTPPVGRCCSLVGCDKIVELLSVDCPACSQSFCLSHRYPHIHNCTHKDKNDHLSRHTTYAANAGATKFAKPRVRGAKSSSLSAKLAEMRLKQTAQPLAPVPESERVYYTIISPSGSGASMQHGSPVYVSTEWSVGKVIDKLAKLLKLTNNNDKPGAKKLLLYAQDGSCLNTGSTITSLLDIVPSGSTLTFCYQT